MAEDIAQLGLDIQWQEVKKANDELDKFGAKGKGAGKAADDFGRRGSEAAKKVANDNRKAAKSADIVAAAYGNLQGRIVAFSAAATAAIVAAFSIQPIFAFKDEMAEISTLVDTATFNMARLENSALSMASQFGGGAAAQVRAFNDVISAGTEDLGKATQIVDAANKLAVGGATSVTVATDGLTTILNAYGDKVDGALSVSDAMFIAMRDGKTTIDELASSIGKVAPIAAQTNVSFDELTAAVAALSLGGISTSESVTGVRAMLASIAKPTKEATDLASQLGIEFNVAGLQAKGFNGFLDDLMEKTGGSTDQLAILFGGVEALVPAMALSGSAGDAFANTMENMASKAGATEEAFTKMANSPSFQAGRLWSALQTEVIKVGGAFGDLLVPAMRLTADNLDLVTKAVGVAGTTLLVALGPTILSSIAFGFGYMAAAAATAMGVITAAIAANPLGALIVAISLVISSLYFFRDEFEQILGMDLADAAKVGANAMIGTFVGAYDYIMQVWERLPDALMGIAKKSLNRLASDLGKPLLTEPFTGKVLIPSPFDFSGFNLELTEAEKNAVGNAEAAFDAGFNRDYVGNLFEGIRGNGDGEGDSSAEDAARKMQDLLDQSTNSANALGNAADTAGGKLKGMGEGANSELDKYKNAAEKAAEATRNFGRELAGGFVQDLRSGLEDGKSFFEAFASAATNALDKIIDKMLNDLLDAIFQVNSAGSGGGGGFLGGLFGGGGGGGFLGGLFGGGTNYFPPAPAPPVSVGLFHDGGMAGHSATTYRSVMPGAFQDAPRYHGGGIAGIGPDEVPAILKRNEPIFRDMNHAKQSVGGGTNSVDARATYNIDARGAQQGVGQEIREALESYDEMRQKRYQGGAQFG